MAAGVPARGSTETAEILLLRHQLAVLQRQQPRSSNLHWADRALLATLLSVMPKARCHGLRLLVTPDTILRWHRDIVRRRRAARSKRGRTGRPRLRSNRPLTCAPSSAPRAVSSLRTSEWGVSRHRNTGPAPSPAALPTTAPSTT
jgi:hypothetical protein